MSEEQTTVDSAPVSSPPPEVKEAALHALAKADDASDFVAESRHQEAENRGDESVNAPSRRTERNERYKRAIEIARNELSGGEPSANVAPDQDAGDAYNNVESLQSREQQIIDATRRETTFKMRAESYFRERPEAREDMAMLEYFEPAAHVADTIINSELGPAIAHELTKIPEAILELNELPPAEAARVIGIVEGRLRAQAAYEQQGSYYAPQRRQTQAPAPMTTLKGGASPRPSLHDLAKNDDATAYVNEVRRRERAQRDGRD